MPMRPFLLVRTAAIGTAVLAGLGAARVTSPPRVTIDTGTLEGLDTAGVMVFRGPRAAGRENPDHRLFKCEHGGGRAGTARRLRTAIG